MTTTDPLAERLARVEELLGVPPPPEVSAMALPPAVAAGQLITSAWGNAVATTLAELVTHVTVGPTNFAAASATSLGGSFGSITLPEQATWLVSASADLHPIAGAWGYVNIWPSTAGDGSANGLQLISAKTYEQSGFNVRWAMQALYLFTAVGPGAVNLRCQTFASSAAFDGSSMMAWRLHKTYT